MEMDPPRQLLIQLIVQRQTDMKSVSLAIGRNHSYIQQFLGKGTPRTLSEDVREELGRHFGLHPDSFKEGFAIEADQAWPGREAGSVEKPNQQTSESLVALKDRIRDVAQDMLTSINQVEGMGMTDYELTTYAHEIADVTIRRKLYTREERLRRFHDRIVSLEDFRAHRSPESAE